MPQELDQCTRCALHYAARMASRIAIIAERFGGVGGGERFVQEVTERLADTGEYEFHVFANRWSCSRSDITFHRVGRVKFPRFLRRWSYAALADRQLRRGQYDLVHAYWPALRADVISCHGGPHRYWVRHVLKRIPNLSDRVAMWMERRMLNRNRGASFLPVSRFVMERFAEVHGALPGEWTIVSPGVDNERFARTSHSRAEVRAQHGLPSTARVVLFVGMNFETKGLDLLLEGLAECRRSHPTLDARLLVVGRGNESSYRRRAALLGIDGAVTFAGSQSVGIERYYSAADALALLSQFETFGMVALEAMAAGLPVIVSDQCGCRDVVQSHGGSVVPIGASAEEVSSALCAALTDDQQLLDRLAAAMRDQCDWGHAAELTAGVYHQILSRQLS